MSSSAASAENHRIDTTEIAASSALLMLRTMMISGTGIIARNLSNISFKNFYVFSCQIYQFMVNSKYKLKQEM